MEIPPDSLDWLRNGRAGRRSQKKMKPKIAVTTAVIILGFFGMQSSSVSQAPGAKASPSPSPVPEFKPLTLDAMNADMAAKSKLMIWDGDKFPNNAKSWTAPPKHCTVTVTKADSHSGKRCVQLHGDGSQYLGFGFNFSGWYPPDAVWDISNYKNLSFWIRIDAAPGKFPNLLNVHLLSAAGGGKESPTQELASYASDLTDGQWHEVVIPLKYFLGQDFDPTQCWEIGFSQWSPDPRVFDIYVDEIGVDNREDTTAPAASPSPAAPK